jgi:deoxyribodipyrimidine photo-lyase
MDNSALKTIFWHRRDLRIEDNAGLYYALKNSSNVQAIFIFDTEILKHLSKNDQRVLFIYQEIVKLKKKYNDLQSDLKVYFGNPLEILPKIMIELHAQSLYTNKDYEPYAINRDKQLYEIFNEKKWTFIAKKDHVIFEKKEVLKADGKPYTVFTPYANKWRSLLDEYQLKTYPNEKYFYSFNKTDDIQELVPLEKMGFDSKQTQDFPPLGLSEYILKDYKINRDFPATKGTSKLSLHLRFGTISIRELAKNSKNYPVYLNELIWRDFYQMILYHFPDSVEHSFKKQYDRIVWENNEDHFKAWCEGKTGYPLVDAGMRELNATGLMHNRVRMVVASFLCKHLLIDWRWGERYFAEKLLDFELASNVGGWQWASSSGCDAAPYFRVFNPTLQQERFDPKNEYIKKWIPEFQTPSYPKPIIEHTFARERVLKRFKEALGGT